MQLERLQKILAEFGLGSRRKMEEVIGQGRVQVNNKVAQLGDKVTVGEDKIRVDGKLLEHKGIRMSRPRILLYHKPIGQICTKQDPEGRTTVFDAVKQLQKGRWVMIGRLDVATSGLLLFTTDGELANRLMHPKYEIQREYAVRTYGNATDEKIDKLKSGVMLSDGLAKFDSISFSGGEGRNSWYHVTISEGRNREVRRMFESVDLQVSRLTRIRYGSISLPKFVGRGATYELKPLEVNQLRVSVGMQRYFFPKTIYKKFQEKN